MSDNNKPKHLILRAYNETRVMADRKDPSKQHGFQVCGIVKGEGRVEEFEQYFDPKKASHFLPPGDYQVLAGGLYLDRDKRLAMEREYVPIKAATKAA
ncbi:hypothetical protein [Dyella sp. LX-1]|uniref:hypothetical protein n=1 Tax=Dyella sp. LX-1 TaxID=2838831 RepID=UPI001BE05F1C|nr:hypothetical protein [Dyella sp. LX-1]MBT2119862.1 hypothetical protein [Dyella sp. LX-1]MBT2119873.1 hypothetical protein [Dyella sp. LX-1]